MLPENAFYFAISDNLGIGESKVSPPKEPSQTSSISVKHLSPEELKLKIFGKSLKTRDSLNFEESQWYQRYHGFKQRRKAVLKKVANEGKDALDEGDKKWYAKYQRFKSLRAPEPKRYKGQEKKTTDTSLLDKFYSEEYKDSWPPMKVFRPTADWLPE